MTGGAPAPPPGEERQSPEAEEALAPTEAEGAKGVEKVIWLKEEEEILLDVLEEAKASGTGGDNGFKAVTYREVATALAKRDGMKPIKAKAKAKDVKVIENHWKIMKGNWREVRNIVAQSGFGWHADEDRVEAETAVWESYVEKNPKAKKWRKRSLWYYTRVDELCAEAVASGEFAVDPALGISAEKGQDSDHEAGSEADDEKV
ncbi:hypothetical protein OC842_007551 [Tilletia horrida]|uniref:Myb/SANT-like domain-containing protein n=1 Tax=Tilletia horrida TaxID=155126 RepID=A0AAN6G616_9BASI|nr:hypothetical protein OC842_007551 [Tilletia horrida]KAK0543883.1 hypothetical protein OC844_007535 [Tilletia horrida]